MKTPARLALFLLGPGLAACTPPAAAPAQRSPALLTLATAAPRDTAAPPIGEPVPVSQRLPWGTTRTDLDSSGRLALVRGYDGLHVVDVETGQTRGVRGGCADEAGFAPEGHAVVATCQEQKTLRIWDLATDTTREVALLRKPLRLELGWAGGRAAVAGAGGVDVIDLKSGAVTTMETHQGRDVTLTALAAGGRVATSDETAVRVFEASGKLVLEVPSSEAPQVIALSPSGRSLALTDAAGLAIIDVDRGKVRAKLTPCASGASHVDVAWTDDELHLVVACGDHLPEQSARVLMLSPDGTEEIELVDGGKDHEHFHIVPLGKRFGIESRRLGGVVFDSSTGKELFRIPPPDAGHGAPRFSRDGERLLFDGGSRLPEISVVDRAGRLVGPRLQPSAQTLSLGRRSGLLALGGMSNDIYVDPATGAAMLDAPGELSPDGTTFLANPGRSSNGFEVVDRASGARRRVDVDTEIDSSPRFSPHGDWVVYSVVRSVGAGSSRRYEYLAHLYDAHTGALGRSFSFGETRRSYSFSDDDKLFAIVTDNGRCEVDPKCEVVQVHDVRSGRRLAAISGMKESRYDPGFLPGGELFLVDGRVHDARSGRVVWTVPAGAAIDATFSHKGQLLLTATDRTLVVDAATGKTVRELEPFDEVVATSDDGAFVLTRRGHEITLRDSAAWTKKPTTLRLSPPYSAVVLARDGRLAWHVEGGDLLAHRFADGRTLRRAMPGFAVDVTDEGVFDPTQIGPGALLARLGPDVERSPMGPSERAAGKLGHPGLFADFVAGKPVSPRP